MKKVTALTSFFGAAFKTVAADVRRLHILQYL